MVTVKVDRLTNGFNFGLDMGVHAMLRIMSQNFSVAKHKIEFRTRNYVANFK